MDASPLEELRQVTIISHVALTPLDMVKIGFAAFLTVDFYRYARSGKARRHLTVFARHTLSDWAKALGLTALHTAAVLAVILFLANLNNPILNFSWLLLLTTPADGPNPSTNLVAAPAQFPWFGLVFACLLSINIPRLARREEEVFRRGTQSWQDALPRSFKFGLIHMIVGVPLCAAIALMGAGLFFTWRYFAGGIREASFYHTLHNFWILGLLMAYFSLSR